MSTFLFGIHCHQPVDNFDSAINEAIERSYLPLFRTLSAHETFRFSVHFSGWLLDKIASEHPELFGLMETMSRRNQIEWLGGGYYEPILASIPSKDRRTQIDMLSDRLEALFGRRPRGIWLTERVWSDEIIGDLCACGIEYTLVDDYHFWRAGFRPDECEGYYLSESGGETIKIFPIQKSLRYLLPFSEHEQAIEAIASMKTAICFDDGEKFGLWPKTYDWVYTDGWLEAFARGVGEEGRITTMHFADYLDACPSRGLAYLPNVSYYEMGGWSYPPGRSHMAEEGAKLLSERFGETETQSVLGGGIWKNFLVKYPEANHIHKRMLSLSDDIDALGSEEYARAVYRAQTNDVLWHGVFGGLYLPNLRDNAYRYLIEAEAIRSRAQGYKCRIGDIDRDGYEEITLINPTLCAIVSTRRGGMLIELDRMARGVNLQNTLTRRQELYHLSLVREQSHEEHKGVQTIHHTRHLLSSEASEALHFDFYERRSFGDHFCNRGVDLDHFYRCDYHEYGDFITSAFAIEGCSDEEVTLGRLGRIGENALKLTKSFRIGEERLEVNISVDAPLHEGLMYVSELNLHFANLSDVVIRTETHTLGARGEMLHLHGPLSLYDPYLDETMRIEWNRECRLFFHPIMTVSQSEGGIDLMVQGAMIAFAFVYEGNLDLECRITWDKERL